MKKSVKTVLSVIFFTSLSGCAYYGNSLESSEGDYASSVKIKEDMEKVSAAIKMASISRKEASVASFDKIEKTLVTNGILMEYPSFNGKDYSLKTSDGVDASSIEDVSFVVVDNHVGRGVCGEVNKQSGVYEIVRVDENSTQVKKYYQSVSKNHDIKKVASLPKTVCYEKVGVEGKVGYEVVSLVSKISLVNRV